MITDIATNHSIFETENYKKDIVTFSLMELIRSGTPMMLKSNEKNCVIGMTVPYMPTWVWTADDIDNDSKKELAEFFFDYFKHSDSVRFVAKPDIAEMLMRPFVAAFNPKIRKIGMESFENPEIIPAKNKDVLIEKPTLVDTVDLSECFAGFKKDCFGETVSAESLLEEAKKKIEKGILWVIKDNGRVVATAEISRTSGTHMAVSGVYTQPEFRCKGYAAAIVEHICRYIVSKGKIPSLYTDLSNPSSNKAYKNIGFQERGRVDEITLTW